MRDDRVTKRSRLVTVMEGKGTTRERVREEESLGLS